MGKAQQVETLQGMLFYWMYGRLQQTPTTNIAQQNACGHLCSQPSCLRHPFEGYILYKPVHIISKTFSAQAKTQRTPCGHCSTSVEGNAATPNIHKEGFAKIKSTPSRIFLEHFRESDMFIPNV